MNFTLTEFMITFGILWAASLVAAAWFGYDWGQSDREWRRDGQWWARRPRWRCQAPEHPYGPLAVPGAERRATLADLDALMERDRQGQAPAPGTAGTGPLAQLYGADYPLPGATSRRRPRHGIMT